MILSFSLSKGSRLLDYSREIAQREEEEELFCDNHCVIFFEITTHVHVKVRPLKCETVVGIDNHAHARISLSDFYSSLSLSRSFCLQRAFAASGHDFCTSAASWNREREREKKIHISYGFRKVEQRGEE